MGIADDLLARGYLPKELPPVFTSAPLATAVSNAQVMPEANPPASELHRHSLARPGGLRRQLSTPHPAHFIHLAQIIEDHWTRELEPLLGQNRFGATKPIPSSHGRSFVAHSSELRHLFRRAAVRSGARYIVKADVQSFYPSIYTHSLPWAIHGKGLAKSRQRDNGLFGNRIDRRLRDAQDRQSIGIPIGPDTSFVLGEVLMVAVERDLLASFPSIRGYRYVDDFEIACESREQAERVRHALEKALAAYELSLNPRKTDIVPLPSRHEKAWTNELRRWPFPTSPGGQQWAIVSFFDRLADLHSTDPETSASAYGLARIARLPIHRENWQLLQELVGTFVVNEPSVLRTAATIFAYARSRGLLPDPALLSKVLSTVIEDAGPLGHDSEVLWSIWLALEHHIELRANASERLGEVEDSFVALLALLASRRGLLQGVPDRSWWRSQMTTAAFSGPHWLLSYEARKRGWLRSQGGGDHRRNDPFFSQLATAGVTFLDLSATTPVSTPAPLPNVGGGGGGAGYPQ